MPDEVTTSVMVALYVSETAAQTLALDVYEALTDEEDDPYDSDAVAVGVDYYNPDTYTPADVRVVAPRDMHVTLLYFPTIALGQVETLIAAAKRVAASLPPATGRYAGKAEFLFGSDGYPCVALVDSLDLIPLRQRLIGAIDGIEYSRAHGFIPHVTLAYSWFEDALRYRTKSQIDFVFDTISVVVGREQRVDFRFAGGIGKSLIEGVSSGIVDNTGDTSNANDVPLESVTTNERTNVEAIATRTLWTQAAIAALPDSAFLHIEENVLKADGETARVRYFPVRDASGAVDIAHVKAAVRQIEVSESLSAETKTVLLDQAKRLLSGSDTSEKSGRRLSRRMADKLNDALATIRGLVKWADYEDEDDTEDDEGDGEKALPERRFFHVQKDANGDDRWLSWSSNGFEDREKEIVSTDALIADVARADKDGNRGPLLLWHTPGTEIGVCDFQTVEGRFLIESGTFLDTDFAQRAKDAFVEYEETFGEPLGTSIGFRHPLGDELDRVYDEIQIIERSVCPLRVAANPFTTFQALRGDARMEQQKREWFAKIFASETAADEIITRAASATKELESLYSYKAVKADEPEPDPPTPPAEPEPPTSDDDAASVAQFQTGLADVLSKALAPVVDAIKTIDTAISQGAERDAARDKTITDLQAAVATLTEAATKTAPSSAPRAAAHRATEVDTNILDPDKAKGLFDPGNGTPATPARPYVDDLIRTGGVQ